MKKILGYASGAATAALLVAQKAMAQPLTGDELFGGRGDQGITGEDFANAAGLSSSRTLPETIASLIQVVLGFLGVVAVVIILMGGFKWMTAGGNDDKVKEAKRLIVQGIIGLVITLSAFAIASFVISSVVGAVNG